MPLDSDVFNHLMTEFGQDLRRVSEDLYDAIHDDVSPEVKARAIAAASAKLTGYDALLQDERFNELRRSKVKKRFEELIDDLRRDFATATETAQ